MFGSLMSQVAAVVLATTERKGFRGNNPLAPRRPRMGQPEQRRARCAIFEKKLQKPKGSTKQPQNNHHKTTQPAPQNATKTTGFHYNTPSPLSTRYNHHLA
jgi:hypothetical protein